MQSNSPLTNATNFSLSSPLSSAFQTGCPHPCCSFLSKSPCLVLIFVFLLIVHCLFFFHFAAHAWIAVFNVSNEKLGIKRQKTDRRDSSGKQLCDHINNNPHPQKTKQNKNIIYNLRVGDAECLKRRGREKKERRKMKEPCG